MGELDFDERMLIISLAGCSLNEKPGKNWVEDEGGLPEPICEMARAIKRDGKTTSQAIAIAVSRAKKLAAEGKAKYVRAITQWEKMRSSARSKPNVKASNTETAVDKVVRLSVLNAERRNKLKDSDFAIPEKRAYPIMDEVHARNALARVAQHGTPEEKRRVRAAVKRRYPNIDVGK